MRQIDAKKEERGPFFVTYLPIYLDYLAVEKGLARNSLAQLKRAVFTRTDIASSVPVL